MSNEIIICLADRKECNDFIKKLDENEAKYVLIGRETWRKKISYKFPIISHWLRDINFNFDYIRSLIQLFMKNQKEEAEYRLVGFNEYTLDFMGKLAADLKIKGISTEASILFRDKYKMLNKVQSLGIRTPRTFLIKDIDLFFENYENTNGYIIKPIDKDTAQDVTFFKDKETCYKWRDESEEDGNKYIIQEFIRGTLFHLDGVVHNNKLQFHYCGKYLISHLQVGKGPKAYMKCLLLPPSEKLTPEFINIHEQIRTAFKLEEGLTHLEVFVSDEDELIFGEIAARPSGGGIIDLHKISYGINAMEYFGALVSGQVIDSQDYMFKEVSGLIAYYPSFYVDEIDDISKFKYDWIVDRNQPKQIWKWAKSGKFTGRLGTIYIKADSEKECKERLEILANEFKYSMAYHPKRDLILERRRQSVAGISA